MATLNRSELLKFIELTALKLSEEETDKLLSELGDLLNYTDELLQADIGQTCTTSRNTNVLREDVVAAYAGRSLTAEAPEADAPYFVVPKIIDDSKEPS